MIDAHIHPLTGPPDQVYFNQLQPIPLAA